MPVTAPTPATSTGTCAFCTASFAKGAMKRHLTHCPARKARIAAADAGDGKTQKVFHLVVTGRYVPDYWLHLEAPGRTTFGALDGFLRDIWLECCGHMSEFTLRTPSTRGMRSGREEVDLDDRLDQVLAKDVTLDHAYDFGSTTYLVLQTAGLREGHPLDQDVVVMARNHPPEILCSECGKPATQISGEWPNKTWCDACIDEGDEEYLLPVVNSPRCGVCGYTGED